MDSYNFSLKLIAYHHPESVTNFDALSPATLPDALDVLVVAAGAVGLYTALCLPSHLKVGLVNKDVLPLSASDWV